MTIQWILKIFVEGGNDFSMIKRLYPLEGKIVTGYTKDILSSNYKTCTFYSAVFKRVMLFTTTRWCVYSL